MDFWKSSGDDPLIVANEALMWVEVGAAIKARVTELKLTQAELERRGGPSDKTMKRYVEGDPIRRPDIARDLCTALGWTSDSIDRLLRGDTPLLIADNEDSDVDERIKTLEREVAELRALVSKTLGTPEDDPRAPDASR